MISFFNKIGNTWVAKAIFAALGISMMAFWGLGGISNTSGKDNTAIQVGRTKISMMELNKAFDLERAKISQIAGQYISPKQAIAMGLLDKTVQEMVADIISKEIQEDLGLTASDAAVRKYVERHPVFKDALGHFDRNLFMAYLAQSKLSEAQLAEQLRNELANQHLSNTIRFATPASEFLAEMKWQHQHQERTIEALRITTDKIVLSKQPTEEELKDYYEAYLSDFMLPETRDIDVLFLTPAQISQNIVIDPDELDQAYQAQKEAYEIPEKRHVYQIRFATEEEAHGARQGLTVANFMEKANQAGQTAENTDFGNVTQTEMLPELAEIAFKSDKNTIIGPVETEMGWHLMTVTDIQPAVTANKTKVLSEIKDKLMIAKAYENLTETARKLEDVLGEGLSVKEAAQRLNLTYQTFKNTQIDGKSLPKEIQNQELMQQVFILKENETTALIEQADGYLVAQVQKITPVQAQTFDAAKTQLKNLWISEQQKAALPDLVQQATEQMKKGSIPAKYGQLMIVKQASLADPQELPQEALSNIFMQESGYENATATLLSDGALITVVKDIKTPVMPKTAMPNQMEQVSADHAELMYSGMIAEYTNQLNIKINTNAIQKAFAVYQTE